MKKFLLCLTAYYLFQISPTFSSTFSLNNDIVFKGSVVNSRAQWDWNVNSELRSVFSNLTADHLSEVKNGSNKVFSYNNSRVNNIEFINGVTPFPITFGSSGLLPVLSIVDMYGKSIVLNNDLESEKIKVPVLGFSRSGYEINGILSFSILSGKAIAYQRYKSDDWYFEYNNNFLGSTALSMILNQLSSDNNSTPSNAFIHEAGYNVFNFAQSNKKDIKSFMGAYSSSIVNVNTIWGTTPHTWSSSVTIQVNYK
ncbi:hypothetical protein ACMAZD_21825 [Vibrio sp. nBUS_14]|uniref:F4 family fimbrial subunit n=1 Tax=Vibrio sp. nBUS_14 TaxID=3395321 RepID=UPI003EBD01DC